jgi:hypothetical protein
VVGFFDTVSQELFAQVWPSNHDPPDVCFLSSWDYRHEPQAP